MTDVMYPEVLVLGNGTKKVAAVGDSLTYGYGLAHREKEAYPSILLDLLGTEYQVMNFGLSGRSLLSTADYPYLQEKNARLSFESRAEVVIVMLGTNDTRKPYWDKERFELEYRQLLFRYQQLSDQTEVLAVVPPFIPTSRFGLDNEIVRTELQELIPKIAAEMGVKSLNLYALTENQSGYYSDGLHLTSFGNRVVAQAVYQAMIS